MRRKPTLPRLTLPQWCLLVELSDFGKEMRVHGRGPLTAGKNLVRLGLATHESHKYVQVFALTEAGKARAKAAP